MRVHLLACLFACALVVSVTANSQIHFTAVMDSAQEVPAPAGLVPGKGTGSFTLNDARTELSYSITVTGLSGGINAGHFHNAPAGVSGGVVRGLTFVGNTASGVWKNTDAQAFTPTLLSELLRGRLYINVHTTANPAGEIRGQVLLSTGVGFTAQIDSVQAVPPPAGNVPGKGTGSFTLNAERTQLAYNITLHGLSGAISAAHFHNAPAGVSAGVVRSISFTGNTAAGVWSSTDGQALTDSMVSELLKGRIYFNAHTTANPAGEIRGQVNMFSGIQFTAMMDSSQEVPAPAGLVPGKGTGSFTLNDARTELSYSITVTGLSGGINAGHFHNAPAGVAGGVVRGLTFAGNTATGVWKNTDAQAFTPTLLSELLRGRLYINVHTTANPAGEIRGQVLLSTGVGFTAQIDSAQEIPAPTGNVPGKGTGSFTLNAGRTQLTYNLTLHGLSGAINAAHFHNAPVGVAGGVVRAIAFTGNTGAGVWTSTDAQALTDSMVSELLKGRIYFNAHTSANPAGEVRGQVGIGNNPVLSVRQISNATPASFFLHQNYPNPFNPSTTITFELPRAGDVELFVYNILGQKIATLVDEFRSPGTYQTTFDASSFSSGMYFYKLSGNGKTETRKMVLLR